MHSEHENADQSSHYILVCTAVMLSEAYDVTQQGQQSGAAQIQPRTVSTARLAPCLVTAQHGGRAWSSTTRHCTAQHGMTQHSMAHCRTAQQAWHSMAWHVRQQLCKCPRACSCATALRHAAVPFRKHLSEQVSPDAILFDAVQVALILPAASASGNALMLQPCQHLNLCFHTG